MRAEARGAWALSSKFLSLFQPGLSEATLANSAAGTEESRSLTVRPPADSSRSSASSARLRTKAHRSCCSNQSSYPPDGTGRTGSVFFGVDSSARRRSNPLFPRLDRSRNNPNLGLFNFAARELSHGVFTPGRTLLGFMAQLSRPDETHSNSGKSVKSGNRHLHGPTMGPLNVHRRAS